MYLKNESNLETGETSGEVVEEEIVELEFEKAIEKLETHNIHCPNCRSEINKVVLRQRVLMSRPLEKPRDPFEQQHNLVGCLSCFSFFTCSENGCFDPFSIFGERSNTNIRNEEGNCLSMFWMFKKEQEVEETEDPGENGDGGPGVGVHYQPDTAIDVLPESGVLVCQEIIPGTEEGSASASLEILKSIVYGGLMEVIASLSVVASADASNAAT